MEIKRQTRSEKNLLLLFVYASSLNHGYECLKFVIFEKSITQLEHNNIVGHRDDQNIGNNKQRENSIPTLFFQHEISISLYVLSKYLRGVLSTRVDRSDQNYQRRSENFRKHRVTQSSNSFFFFFLSS